MARHGSAKPFTAVRIRLRPQIPIIKAASPLKVTFLGTGTSQGIPVIACGCEVCQSPDPKDKRLRTSIHVEINGLSLVVDTGPDFRQQMLRENINTLDAVIFTHAHKDHIAGMDDIRAYNFIQQKAVPIYADKIVQEALRRDFHYVFADEKYPGIPEVEMNTIEYNTPFTIGTTKIEPIMVWHYRLPVLGFRFGDFTYITDANRIDKVEKEKIKGSKALVLNALRKTEHISHFTLDEAIALAQELQVPDTYLIHLSHQMGRHEEVTKELPAGIHIAYDGLQLNID